VSLHTAVGSECYVIQSSYFAFRVGVYLHPAECTCFTTLFYLNEQAVREDATIFPRPLQRKRAAAALSQAGRAGPDEPIRAIPAGRLDVRDRRRQTDVRRQTRIIA